MRLRNKDLYDREPGPLAVLRRNTGILAIVYFALMILGEVILDNFLPFSFYVWTDETAIPGWDRDVLALFLLLYLIAVTGIFFLAYGGAIVYSLIRRYRIYARCVVAAFLLLNLLIGWLLLTALYLERVGGWDGVAAAAAESRRLWEIRFG